MKQEIRERIEKIRKGEVPEGYKLTKAGIIPKEWETLPLKKAVIFLDSKRKPIEEKERAKMKGIYPYYGASGIIDYVNDYLFDEELILLGEDGANIIMRSTPLAFKISGKNWVNNHAHVLKPTKDMDIDFLIEILESINYRIYNTGTAQPKLNSEICKSIIIKKPLYEEQNEIGNIILTWDKAIELKEKLIEEKKEFKRGVMQKLLTGEMRFLGFTDDWEETRLGKKLTFIKKESIENPQNYRLLTVKLHLKGIEATENCPKLTENGRPYHLRYEGELLIGRQNFHNGGIGIIPNGMNGYIASNAISSLKSSDDNLLYYYYYLSNPNFYKKVEHLIGGTGQKEISESMFKKLKIKLPSNDKEIKKISETIKDIYQDLELENNILSQLKEQKIGLMQLLLTGIVRVEVD